MQRKVVGLAALAGFLACTAWSAGLVPSACCSESCEPCPIILCKSTAVNTSQKVDIAQPLAPSILDHFRLTEAAAPIATLAQIPSSLRPEFRRPMRN